MYPLHKQRELEFTMRCLLPLKCRTTNIRRSNASHAIPSAGQHLNSRRSTTHLPTKHALPQTPLSETPFISNRNERFHASTNTPIQCPTNACTQQAGPIRTLSPHRSFHPTPHPPALQSTHQCPCTHNALHNRPSNNSPPAQFKPCHANSPPHRRVNTKPNPEPPLPLPKLSTPA